MPPSQTPVSRSAASLLFLILFIGALSRVEATGTWTPTASMSTARGGHTAILLPDGRVLVSCGAASTATS
jgi:hypothetical protein